MIIAVSAPAIRPAPLAVTAPRSARLPQRLLPRPRLSISTARALSTAMGQAQSSVTGPGSKLECEKAHDCIYLDYNATTPVFPEVADEMEPFLRTHFGNPSSTHAFGGPCKGALGLARDRVAALIGCKPGEIIFTACGTESDNTAILGAVTAAGGGSGGASEVPHVVSSEIEHPAVLEALAGYKELGLLDYTLVGCDAEGIVSAADVEAAFTPNTKLVTIMHSNNEVGALQPVADVAARARARGILVHTDAAQSMGKVPVKVHELGVDMATVVGHKFGAPKGVAALFVKDGVKLGRMLLGGGQEGGRRAGTESVLLIAGLGKAAAIAEEESSATPGHMVAMRERLLARIAKGLPDGALRTNGPKDPAQRLPNTLSVSVKGLVASTLLSELASDVAASAGAACHSSGGPSISSVLAAMKVPEEYAVGTLRLSVGRHSVPEDVDRAADLIIARARAQLGA